MRSRECELFGKSYMWVEVMGRLELRPAIDWDMPARDLATPPTLNEILAWLDKVEDEDGQGYAPH